jgi:hypothetical protein
MSYPLIVDARNIYEPETMAELDFAYYPTGRPGAGLQMSAAATR